MSRVKKSIVLALFVGIAFAISVIAQAQSTVRPGEMTQARVWVQNRTRAEAVPVTVEDVVRLEPSTAVQTTVRRQAWEYRIMTVPRGVNPARNLNNAGLEGWEAVGIAEAGPGEVTVLLKRPQ